MGIILSKKKCLKCKINYVYKQFCGGDWYKTINDYVQQAYCPKCGEMIPLVSRNNPFYISNNNILRFSRLLSIKNNIKFQKTKEVAKTLQGLNDSNIVIKIFSEKLDLPTEKIQRTFIDFLRK